MRVKREDSQQQQNVSMLSPACPSYHVRNVRVAYLKLFSIVGRTCDNLTDIQSIQHIEAAAFYTVDYTQNTKHNSGDGKRGPSSEGGILIVIITRAIL
jgi:hypothetical protein